MAAGLLSFLALPAEWVYLPTALCAASSGAYYALAPLVLFDWHGPAALGAPFGALMSSGVLAQLPQAWGLGLAHASSASCKGDLGCFSLAFNFLIVACVLTGAWAWLFYKARRERRLVMLST